MRFYRCFVVLLLLVGCHKQQPNIRTIPVTTDARTPLVFVERDSVVWADTVSVSSNGNDHHVHHLMSDSLFATTLRSLGIEVADTVRGAERMVDIVLYVQGPHNANASRATSELRLATDSVVGYTIYRFDALSRHLLATTSVRGGSGSFFHIDALDASTAGWSHNHRDRIRTGVLPLFGRRANVCLDLYRYGSVNHGPYGYMTIINTIARDTDEFGPAIDRYRRTNGKTLANTSSTTGR